MDDMTALAQANKFNSLEKPKCLKLLKDPWTENDLLTPTMKMKRNLAKARYEKEILEMYESLQK